MITDDFQALPAEALHHSRSMPTSDFEPNETIADHAKAAATEHGLTYMGQCNGRRIIDDHGEPSIVRRKLYTVAPRGRERESAAALVASIAARHGAGHWWSAGLAVNYLGQHMIVGAVRGCTIDGTPHVLMAAYYFHDPMPKGAP